jgi:hypothetical protein
MKALVETTAPILIMDSLTGDVVEWNRPSVVTWSSFLEGRAGARQIRVLNPHLKDETSDADFVQYLKDSDGKMDLAVASFLAEFAVVEQVGAKTAATPVEKKIDIAPKTKLIGGK